MLMLRKIFCGKKDHDGFEAFFNYSIWCSIICHEWKSVLVFISKVYFLGKEFHQRLVGWFGFTNARWEFNVNLQTTAIRRFSFLASMLFYSGITSFVGDFKRRKIFPLKSCFWNMRDYVKLRHQRGDLGKKKSVQSQLIRSEFSDDGAANQFLLKVVWKSLNGPKVAVKLAWK